MIDISVQNVKKAFDEGVDVLNGLSFEINEGERVGIIGKNGAGKTTLFRLLAGEMEPDEGDIVIPGHRKLGLISQIPEYPKDYTAERVLRTAFDRLDAIKREMERIESRMSAGGGDGNLREYDRLAYEYERSGGYNTDFELNRVANGLEIPLAQREQLFSSLSGGEKTRVNLARLILENTDILLLDEPTNHLDMRATQWLEDYLCKFKGTALIISHDRYFLDMTISRVIELSAGKAEFYSGNYSFYVGESERRYLETLTKYEREQAEAKRLNAAADRLYQWGTGNKNLMKKSFAIRKRAERLVMTDRPIREKQLSARVNERDFFGDEALRLRGIKKAYDGRTLFEDVEALIEGGERIALIGDNGAGKTTLIRIIVGEERPDEGAIKAGPAVKMAYLPQTVSFPNPRRTLMDTLVYELNMPPQTARNRLGAFKFSGDEVFKQVSDLSGGEKSRLRLCMLLSNEINLLILDEPTNHLDIASREWIERAVEEYGGTLLFISHDRYFIEKFATRIWELDGGSLSDFKGTFSQYRAQKSAVCSLVSAKVKKNSDKQKKAPSVQKELARVEREIEKLENDISELKRQAEEFSSDYEKLMELDSIEQEAQSLLNAKYAEWEELLAKAE